VCHWVQSLVNPGKNQELRKGRNIPAPCANDPVTNSRLPVLKPSERTGTGTVSKTSAIPGKRLSVMSRRR